MDHVVDGTGNDKSELEKTMLFLELADIREFSYDIGNDILENVRYGKEKEIFFRGSLSDWAEDYRKRMGEEAAKASVPFINALREGKESFQISYEYKGLPRLIKAKTRTEDDGRRIVYGVMMAGQAQPVQAVKEPVFKRASDRDPMLNMLNKKAITEYAQKMCEMKDVGTVYLTIFDLDNFKVVNDTFGHLYGDEVLVTVTDIINKAVEGHGMVGRLGGDEIMIVTKGISDKAELRPILREIRMNVEDAFKDKMSGISLTCSMGAAAFPDHGRDYKAVLDLADKMLYLAKEKGRNRYIIYTPDMHQELLAHQNSGEEVKGTKFNMAFDKIGIIQFMLDDYLRNGTSSNEAAFASVGSSFMLSEILIVYEGGKVGFRWTPEGISDGELDLKWLNLDQEFYSRFDENNLYVIDWLYTLAASNPRLEKKLRKQDIQSALFYRLRSKGRPEGYIMFAKKSQRQKWSEYEILALSTIAKIFEMSVYK